MAIATYTDLFRAGMEYLARDNDVTLGNRFPDFITLFEAKANRVLTHPMMEVRSITDVDTSAAEPEFITLPLDFQAMRRIRLSSVTGKPVLKFLSQTQIESYRYSRDNTTGRPCFYSIVGNELELAPTPNENFTLEMVYRANIPPLSASAGTNWLLSLAPDLYLYGSLLEAAPYLKDDARIPVWAAAVESCIDQLNTHGHRQNVDPGPSTISLPGPTP